VTDRLLDALARAYEPPQRRTVSEILLAGAAQSAPLVDPLAGLFGGAALILIERDADALNAVCNDATGGRLRPVRSGLVDLPDLAPGPYDLIIIRHPDIVYARAAWEAGLRACVSTLAGGGTFVTTAESLADAAFLDGALTGLGLTLRAGSPYTPEPVALDGADRYILIHDAASPAP
jgi:hypothetical protein